ncbi:MAG: hypothetical protein B7O98_01645 [Zestosphaera tikiterensis]|uniref:Transglutaminase-like domain-containing protein n=1 Tax=Zestosphaera tikiterensis TaxID=1973259 RepID=A0A2R7Y6Z9_9CREN|nr:MAG: hypothetical protein B7O98_01645 [Zestosphaera tikiterensis]
MKLPRYALPLFVVYLANSVKGMDRLKELVLRVQSSVPELSNYFEGLYADVAVSSTIHSELYRDIQTLHMRKYINVYGTTSELEKILYTVTNRGRAFVEDGVIPVLQPDVYVKVREVVRTYLGLGERSKSGAVGYSQSVGEFLEAMGFKERPYSQRMPTHAEMASYVESMLESFIREQSEKLTTSLGFCRTAYCVAMAIDSVYSYFSSLNTELRLGLDLREVLKQVLEHPNVIKAAAKIQDIKLLPDLARADVRFKTLRSVSDVIASWTSRIVSERPKERLEAKDKEYVIPVRIEYEPNEKEAGTEGCLRTITVGTEERSTEIGRTTVDSQGKEVRSKRLSVFAKVVIALIAVLALLPTASLLFHQQLNETPPTTTAESLKSDVLVSLVPTTTTATTALLRETSPFTPSMLQQYRERLDLGSMKIYVNDTHLIIEEFWSGKPSYPYFVIKGGEYKLHLTPYPIDPSTSHVIAAYVFVNKTYAKALFPLNEILEALKRAGISNFEIDLYDVSKTCELRVDWSKKSMSFGGCENVIFIRSLSFGNTFYDVILSSFNETTISYLRKLVYDNVPPRDVKEAAWKALEWVDENAGYDYVKAGLVSVSNIYDPIEFAERRSGVCADYAVFLVATLISAGVKPVYILSLNTTEGRHATAAVEINDTLFVLDQHLPVAEWSDYLEYEVNILGYVYVYRVSYDTQGGPTVEFYKLSKDYRDTYFSDAIPSKFADDVCKELAAILGASCTYACRSEYSWRIRWTWDVLKLYSPLFHKQWVDYIAKELAPHIEDRPLSVWVEVESPTTLVVYYR